jgi:hypothetical protein
MTREDLEQVLNEATFNPFALTTADGFSIAIATPRDTLLGQNVLVVRDTLSGRIYTFALRSITHLTEQGTEL